MKALDWLNARTPYRYKGNGKVRNLGFGVEERAFMGTSPGAPYTQLFPQAGIGGIAVKRQMFPAAPAPLIAGGTGAASVVSTSGLTGGLYQTGQLTLTALQQYIAQQAYNGNGAPLPPGYS